MKRATGMMVSAGVLAATVLLTALYLSRTEPSHAPTMIEARSEPDSERYPGLLSGPVFLLTDSRLRICSPITPEMKDIICDPLVRDGDTTSGAVHVRAFPSISVPYLALGRPIAGYPVALVNGSSTPFSFISDEGIVPFEMEARASDGTWKTCSMGSRLLGCFGVNEHILQPGTFVTFVAPLMAGDVVTELRFVCPRQEDPNRSIPFVERIAFGPA